MQSYVDVIYNAGFDFVGKGRFVASKFMAKDLALEKPGLV